MDSVEAIELTIIGWIKKCEKDLDIIIPDSLRLVIFLYFPKVIRYKGRFLQTNCGSMMNTVSKDKITGYRSAKLDIPLPISINTNEFNKSLQNIAYRWKVRTTWNSVMCCDYCMVGVVSNRCTDLHQYAGGMLQDSYGISLHKNSIFSPKRILLSDSNDYDDKLLWNKNDVIVVEYEISKTNKCKLYFYNESKQNRLLYSMDLPNDNKEITNWYPAFSKPNDGGYIELVYDNLWEALLTGS